MKKKSCEVFLLWVWLLVGILATVQAENETAPAPSIVYTLSMPQPQTHFFEVEMRLSNFAGLTSLKKNGYVDVKMPVWTPGSYLIREYARNVEGFTAQSGGKALPAQKINKNTWRITTADDNITLRYRVYANELSVRTSHLDATHGYLNGASIFLYQNDLKGYPHQVVIQPFTGWNKVSTGLEPVNGQPFTFRALNYDILVDSPIEIGNHRTFTFTASGIPHTVAMYGEVEYDATKLAADYKKVCEAAATVIGEHPCQSYTFIVHHFGNPSGGLEHQNSTTLQTTREAYKNETNYKRFLTLVAHEYFHLWNVKRIRPVALGPFDYDNENYTSMLWVSEGFTSFYEDYILRRAGYFTPDQYLNILAGDINSIENQPGSRVQSVAESSFDAWIKAYRPNENSTNSTISYYTKGSVLANLLNLTILANTNGTRNLDDLMRFLWNEYYKKRQRGFTDEEFKKAAEQVANRNLDDFFRKYVYGTEVIDYNAFVLPFGLQLANTVIPNNQGYLGAATTFANGKLTVSSVRRNSAAWNGGLNTGDEILFVDSVRVGADLNNALAGKRTGDKIRVMVNRDGIQRELNITLAENPLLSYRFEMVPNPTQQQRALLNRWLNIQNQVGSATEGR
ncbi:PDZ domain-containing protein [Nibrella saemangeumensis]|uniref:PDZ domain-containing protein n=1 Tax=Nibrella saemangeumensis TaxID=1084526 RepID=A0ABP8MJX6_9BACT